MWPLDLPARDVLKLPGSGASAAWAIFDPDWYRNRYPAVGSTATSCLHYYLAIGQAEAIRRTGCSTSVGIVQRIRRSPGAWRMGGSVSAFDAYCRRGCLDRSPHWLFDELGYRDRYPDLSNDVLAAVEVANGYDHYLRHGAAEDRIGHVLFDPHVYLANFDAADVAGDPPCRRISALPEAHRIRRAGAADLDLFRSGVVS